MDLRKATNVVVRDLLNNNLGSIAFEDVNNANPRKLDKIALELCRSDYFLIKFNEMGEDLLNEYFSDFGDEYDIDE